MDPHFWQKSPRVPRDRLLGSMVLKKKKKKEGRSRSVLYSISCPRSRVLSFRTIAKSRCPHSGIHGDLHISLISSMAGRKPDAGVRGLVRTSWRSPCNKVDARVARETKRGRWDEFSNLGRRFSAAGTETSGMRDRLGPPAAKGLTRDWR